jgi:hypothetical protein
MGKKKSILAFAKYLLFKSPWTLVGTLIVASAGRGKDELSECPEIVFNQTL